jgi:ATP-dependent protease ClpP protease subunit
VDAWGGDWGVSASEFAALLDALGDDVTAIDLLINSPGGDVFEGTTILNQLRAHPAKVNVTVQGIAASIASVIMMAGDTIEMAAGSSTMIHDAAGLAIGNAHDMHAMAGVLDKISDNIAAVYAERAGGEPAAWRAVMSAEQWYSADEAVAAGLADRVTPKLTKDAKAASNRFDLTAFAHAGRENAPPPAMPAARAPQTPAAPLPVAPSTDPKEADAMSDTLLEGLRTQLGLPADADEATVLAANAEALTERADPKDAPPVAAVPAGMTLVDAQQWADVKVMAARGAQAAQRQSADDRDATIAKAIADGKLSRNEGNVTKLKADWDADPAVGPTG